MPQKAPRKESKMSNPNDTLPDNLKGLVENLSTRQAIPLGTMYDIPFLAVKIPAEKESFIQDNPITCEIKPSVFNVDFHGETVAVCFIQVRLNGLDEYIYTATYDLTVDKQFSDCYALLNMRKKDSVAASEQYSIVSESHCKGHQEDRELTVSEYRKEQGCDLFDEHNREWYRLILKKKSGGPGVGAPSEMSKQLFFMASYNGDMFRKFVLSRNFRATYDLPHETYEKVAEDDIALLNLGYRLMRQVLFGERTISEQDGAWEKRVQERKDVWTARTNAEIGKRKEAFEQDMGEEQ